MINISPHGAGWCGGEIITITLYTTYCTSNKTSQPFLYKKISKNNGGSTNVQSNGGHRLIIQ